jgi:RimJ/RimL family protein N-acetyltransferase
VILGDGVGLRPIEEKDLAFLKRCFNDPFTEPMFYSQFLMSDGALLDWHHALLSSSSRMRFIIQRLDDGAAVGLIGLEHIDYRNQEAELAGLIIDPTERRCGWGKKATNALISYAFKDLHMHRLFARIYASNTAARRLTEKVGLKFEGAMRQALYHNWGFEDLVYVSILRGEWQHE